ncbi:hypothetical protein N7414_27000 [Pseudomonas sp. GD04087]|uniref:hypothetical protein n=1 Tax=Pseudomonas TaxID=286 RepID=UPI001F410764|nr:MULTISPECIES: hypothetical protein [Pseudomonas]MDH0292784.1 hypothetical protein [Pseudomonas sp. GD04087]MDH1051445.1 hypothetical protein [Pseudomonas sp. GD03903]MDH2002429.1 hypothetical protein [Pseudomonas sp. GD03691]
MCPLCVSTLTLAVTSVLSAGGVSAFAVTRLRGRRRARSSEQRGLSQEPPQERAT